MSLSKSVKPGEPSVPLLGSDAKEGEIPSSLVPLILWQARELAKGVHGVGELAMALTICNSWLWGLLVNQL